MPHQSSIVSCAGRTTATRRVAAALALAPMLTLAGCEWSLSIESGGASLAETILQQFGFHIDNNQIVPNSLTRPLGGGGGGGGGEARAGDGGEVGGDSIVTPEIEARMPAARGPVFAVIGGHAWHVSHVTTTVGPDPRSSAMQQAVWVEIVASPDAAHAGVFATARLMVPIAQWPRDAQDQPVLFTMALPSSPVVEAEPDRSALAARGPTPTLPLPWPVESTGLEIAGVRYAVDVIRTSARSPGPGPGPGGGSSGVGAPIEGVIDAIARRADARDRASQLFRVVFRPEPTAHEAR